MGDMGDFWNDVKAGRKSRRERFALNCPGCVKDHPKRNPTKLMPGQRCKVCGYQDRRSGRNIDKEAE